MSKITDSGHKSHKQIAKNEINIHRIGGDMSSSSFTFREASKQGQRIKSAAS